MDLTVEPLHAHHNGLRQFAGIRRRRHDTPSVPIGKVSSRDARRYLVAR